MVVAISRSLKCKAMKAIVKSMWIDSPTIKLNSYVPDNPEDFSLWIEVRVGPDDSACADDYRILVCTPEWICRNIWEPHWGRHMLIVRRYDRSVIERCVRDYIASCTGDEWGSVAKKIARNLFWEFEDYQN
jgi:Immunity protein 8